MTGYGLETDFDIGASYGMMNRVWFRQCWERNQTGEICRIRILQKMPWRRR